MSDDGRDRVERLAKRMKEQYDKWGTPTGNNTFEKQRREAVKIAEEHDRKKREGKASRKRKGERNEFSRKRKTIP